MPGDAPGPFGPLTLLGAGLLIAVTAFAAVWAISVRIRNYGLLDAAFSYGVAVLAPLYAAFGSGWGPRAWLFAAVGGLWSVRLGTHILVRVMRAHPVEDARYQSFRDRWPSRWRFLAFFELQAVLVAVFSLPFLFAAHDPATGFRATEIAGLALALLAIGGEALADWQMQRFKADRRNAGRVCDVGLWRWSRHPNYFFESLVWWGFALGAFGAPFGWIALACPLLMLYFLLRVTGIPLTEEYAVKRKGDAYREYQRRTSAFVPWFRRA